MAITTYSELQSSVASWLNREDLTSVIPDFIALTEAQLQHELRHWRMQERSHVLVGSDIHPVPSDWHETIRLSIDGKDLELLSAGEMSDMQVDDTPGTPRYYRHTDQSFEFYPAPDDAVLVIMEYYKRIPALSDTNTTNWLLTYAPDAYLYGALMHASTFLADDARIALFAQMYAAAIQRLNGASDKSLSSGTSLKVRPRTLGVYHDV